MNTNGVLKLVITLSLLVTINFLAKNLNYFNVSSNWLLYTIKIMVLQIIMTPTTNPTL